MPFDGKEQQFTETKPDVFSLDGLIAWLEKQPGEREYDYCSSPDCLLTRYFASHGVDHTPPTPGKLTTSCIYGGRSIYNSPMHTAARHAPWTFGAALQRARDLAALARQKGAQP
jgi:hypothetical protein